MEWKVEEMKLMNEVKLFIGKERIYTCEYELSREDKIEEPPRTLVTSVMS